tara:strand:+ start:829 stop:1002 length:174 start_codon:yes stop_codon:yes gene_type:complete
MNALKKFFLPIMRMADDKNINANDCLRALKASKLTNGVRQTKKVKFSIIILAFVCRD